MNTTPNQDRSILAPSQAIALDNIWLRPASRWGHTEYSFEYHKEYLARHTGLADDGPERLRQAFDQFAFDFIWYTQDGLVDWAAAGRTTDMGHAAYALDASDLRQPKHSPFTTEEEVWAFDAVQEYGLPDFDEQVRAYEAILQAARATFPNQLTTGGYYKTIVSGAIDAFGWDMLLLAAADSARMENVFDSFFRRTLFHMQAWAQTSAEVDHPARRFRLDARPVYAPGHLPQGAHPPLRRAVETVARRRQEGALLFGWQLDAICRGYRGRRRRWPDLRALQ